MRAKRPVRRHQRRRIDARLISTAAQTIATGSRKASAKPGEGSFARRPPMARAERSRRRAGAVGSARSGSSRRRCRGKMPVHQDSSAHPPPRRRIPDVVSASARLRVCPARFRAWPRRAPTDRAGDPSCRRTLPPAPFASGAEGRLLSVRRMATGGQGRKREERRMEESARAHAHGLSRRRRVKHQAVGRRCRAKVRPRCIVRAAPRNWPTPVLARPRMPLLPALCYSVGV